MWEFSSASSNSLMPNWSNLSSRATWRTNRSYTSLMSREELMILPISASTSRSVDSCSNSA